MLNSIKNVIEKNYKLKNVEISKNEDSTDGNVYNLLAMQKKYILKIYDDKDYTISMIKLYKNLNDMGLYVPTILINNNNESYTQMDNKFLIMYSFLEGKEIKTMFDNIPNNISEKLAKELRKLHDKSNGLNNIGLKEIKFFENKIRKSVLHFDLTRRNIFYNENIERIGFIDFDDAKYGGSMIDVAILIANLYFSKKRGKDIEGAKKFIDEYYKNDLTTKTIEVPLIKETAIKWIDYTLNGNEFNSSITDSFEIKKKLIKEVDFRKFI